MKDFIFHSPTKIIFGRGKNGKIGKELAKDGISKILLVYGMGSIKRNGVYDEVVSSLKDSGISFVELGGIKPNPVLSRVYEGIKLARSEGCEAVLGVGGGSVIDSAKAIAAGIPYEGDVWDFYSGKDPEEALPIYSILTLSATGSEMNGNSVITRDETMEKKGCTAG